LVLNEPETSLHPDLLPALGRLIANAADRSQVLVVTHAKKLIATLEKEKECNSVRLEKEFGETKIVGIEKLELPRWQWAAR
jgi:predicted ATPase